LRKEMMIMANVVQCDRCGKICTYDERYIVDIAKGADQTKCDLCLECREKLISFLNLHKEDKANDNMV